MTTRRGLTVKDISPGRIKLPTIIAKTSVSKLVQFDLKLEGGIDLGGRIKAAIDRASVRIVEDLKAALDNALRSGVWAGVEGTADIFETGELLQSGNVTLGPDGIEISYDAPYAALVHFGGYIYPYGNKKAKVYLPPRPWVESVLSGGGPVPQFDFARYFLEEIREEFGSI